MTAGHLEHSELLDRVAGQLSRTATATDHLMLTKWRVFTICEHLFWGGAGELESVCKAALEAFCGHGPGDTCDKAVDAAVAAIRQSDGDLLKNEDVLPSISTSKRRMVSEYLASIGRARTDIVDRALGVLPMARGRVVASAKQGEFPGLLHRFDLVASVLEDKSRSDRERARAAAAVLYVNDVNDVIPDALSVIGMIDDDHALRIVLEESDQYTGSSCLHWSEKICSLWDDLPFLRGVNLSRKGQPISITWLDRVNSYVCYSHVMGSDQGALILLQPSIACLPLHSVISLIGLLVLDAITSSENRALALRSGQVYEVDGFFLQFEGIAGPPVPGWLRLRFRDAVAYQPPSIADRFVPVHEHSLSTLRKFSSRPGDVGTDPIQRFFGWDVGIGPASIASRLVLVASRHRALELLEGVESNGVRLLDHSLVRFVGPGAESVETHGTLVLVVPSLGDARRLMQQGIRVQAILVDGYDRLRRGRHELPFFANRRDAPPLIVWATAGYFPASVPGWLPGTRLLEVSPMDLTEILDLESVNSDISQATLWEAATGRSLKSLVTDLSPTEVKVLGAIDGYIHDVIKAEQLPEYWRYHLTSMARTLHALISVTPAEWSKIGQCAAMWSASVDEKWASLRPGAVCSLKSLRVAEYQIRQLIGGVSEVFNSRARGLVSNSAAKVLEGRNWRLVCEDAEPFRAASSAVRALGLGNVRPILLRELPVCEHCIVTGWQSTSFARRLFAHTPQSVIAIADEEGRTRWERLAARQMFSGGESVLDSIGPRIESGARGVDLKDKADDDVDPDEQESAQVPEADWVPCVILWLTERTEARVLDPRSRVVVEDGDVVRERVASALRPDDKIILGIGASRWSPADQFTGAVLDAVRASHPELVARAGDWRRALRRVVDLQRLSTYRLQARLAELGIERHEQTLEGWLDSENAAPIGPRGMRPELSRLWPFIEQHAEFRLDEVADACTRLRALRVAAGRALLQIWKGKSVALGIDQGWLEALVDQLREAVRVYEVSAMRFGRAPPATLGWWMAPSIAAKFESGDGTLLAAAEAVGEDDDA